MDHRTVQPSPESAASAGHEPSSAGASLSPATHPVLSRLMEEVRNERYVEARYDRVHNRHNRGG